LYIQAGKLNVTLKGFDPLEITLEEALALVQAKLEQEANKVVKKFEGTDIQILNGQWGPYISDTVKKINAKIAKTENPHDLTLEECQRRLVEAPSKPMRGAKKAVARKPATTTKAKAEPKAKAPAKPKAPAKAKTEASTEKKTVARKPRTTKTATTETAVKKPSTRAKKATSAAE
jgi:DNA topoisomerase-1